MTISKLDRAKINFVLFVALVIMGAGAASRVLNHSAISGFVGVGDLLIGLVAVLLVVALSFKFGDEIMRLKKEEPERRDVFDYTTRDTSGAVLGKLAEIKYGQRKKRDSFESYYKIK